LPARDHPGTVGETEETAVSTATLDRTDKILALLARVKALNPADLAWHASRYDAGHDFRLMVVCARQGGCGTGRTCEADNLGAWVATIAGLCADDGAARGFVPCLGGPALEVWRDLLALYEPKTARAAYRKH
jgi:hypothetical protein